MPASSANASAVEGIGSHVHASAWEAERLIAAGDALPPLQIGQPPAWNGAGARKPSRTVQRSPAKSKRSPANAARQIFSASKKRPSSFSSGMPYWPQNIGRKPRETVV